MVCIVLLLVEGGRQKEKLVLTPPMQDQRRVSPLLAAPRATARSSLVALGPPSCWGAELRHLRWTTLAGQMNGLEEIWKSTKFAVRRGMWKGWFMLVCGGAIHVVDSVD